MADFQLSEMAIATLQLQGWFPERQAEIRPDLKMLEEEGIVPHPLAIEFLKSFGGLKLDFGRHGGLSGMHFEVIWPLRFLSHDELVQMQKFTGKVLCPVGMGGRFLMLLATDGETIFLHDEWWLYLHARNVRDAFDLMCNREFRNFESVDLPEENDPFAN